LGATKRNGKLLNSFPYYEIMPTLQVVIDHPDTKQIQEYFSAFLVIIYKASFDEYIWTVMVH
jgi:hypothetical protein